MLDIRKEVEFWTLIMRDHAKFQYDSLSPKEQEAIRKTVFFKNLFEELHQEVSVNIQESIPNLITKNKNALTQFIEFKTEMLKKLMTCEIGLGMAPSFLNHMINEAMEFYRVLSIAEGTVPYNKVLEIIRLHKIWLPDASGHANFISSNLDAIETSYIKKAHEFAMKFDGLFKKAYEMYLMFERTGLSNGGLKHFNNQVETTLFDFIEFLSTIEKLRKDCLVYATGLTVPLVPNHMIREEKYYMYRVKSLED